MNYAKTRGMPQQHGCTLIPCVQLDCLIPCVCHVECHCVWRPCPARGYCLCVSALSPRVPVCVSALSPARYQLVCQCLVLLVVKGLSAPLSGNGLVNRTLLCITHTHTHTHTMGRFKHVSCTPAHLICVYMCVRFSLYMCVRVCVCVCVSYLCSQQRSQQHCT